MEKEQKREIACLKSLHGQSTEWGTNSPLTMTHQLVMMVKIYTRCAFNMMFFLYLGCFCAWFLQVSLCVSVNHKSNMFNLTDRNVKWGNQEEVTHTFSYKDRKDSIWWNISSLGWLTESSMSGFRWISLFLMLIHLPGKIIINNVLFVIHRSPERKVRKKNSDAPFLFKSNVHCFLTSLWLKNLSDKKGFVRLKMFLTTISFLNNFFHL